MKPRLMLAVVLVAAICGAVSCGRPTTGADNEVALPTPRTKGKVSVEEALARRRSVRQFARKALTLEQVGQLAWAAQGITAPSQGLRTAPSAGATYPMEIYLAKQDGVFHYLPKGHKLERVSAQDKRAALAQAALGQSAVQQAAVDVVLTAVYERTRERYGDRAERYVHMEAGHIGQNLHLQAVALGLGSVSVGAFDDAAVSQVLGLPPDQAPVCIIPIGYPAGRGRLQ
jgi:SagB-type dehydrogenase family enzyme